MLCSKKWWEQRGSRPEFRQNGYFGEFHFEMDIPEGDMVSNIKFGKIKILPNLEERQTKIPAASCTPNTRMPNLVNA